VLIAQLLTADAVFIDSQPDRTEAPKELISMLKRISIGCALVAALALSASASAAVSPSDYKNTSKFCKALKAENPTLFKATYGTGKNHSNAHGKCVSKNVKTVAKVHDNAVSDCREERAADEAVFNDKYGSGKNGKNAFGKCVSTKQKASLNDLQDEIVNAARECRAERKSLTTDVFNDKWGKNENDRNAFGKCVSAHRND
jgi:hypothetical protein